MTSAEHLVLLVDELLEAHDDTMRLSEELLFGIDQRWDAHLCYLRDLRRVGHEVLAAATADGDLQGPSWHFPSSFPRRGDRRCERHGHGQGLT